MTNSQNTPDSEQVAVDAPDASLHALLIDATARQIRTSGIAEFSYEESLALARIGIEAAMHANREATSPEPGRYRSPNPTIHLSLHIGPTTPLAVRHNGPTWWIEMGEAEDRITMHLTPEFSRRLRFVLEEYELTYGAYRNRVDEARNENFYK